MVRRFRCLLQRFLWRNKIRLLSAYAQSRHTEITSHYEYVLATRALHGACPVMHIHIAHIARFLSLLFLCGGLFPQDVEA